MFHGSPGRSSRRNPVAQAKPRGVTTQNLHLLLQSSRDALGESLADLERAVHELEVLEARGIRPPLPTPKLERARTQTAAAHRILEDLVLRWGPEDS